MMDPIFKLPPDKPSNLSSLEELQKCLTPLIGTQLTITKKSRTDGSNNRKLIAAQLLHHGLPNPATNNTYEIVPPKKKGVPKILLEFIDTYIVTSGSSYNLQVWNRIPNSNSILVAYDNLESLKCYDVRFVLTKVDIVTQEISMIAILTADYIVSNFGNFGKPTIKHQLLISQLKRNDIINSKSKVFFHKDSPKLSYLLTDEFNPPPKGNMVSDPTPKNLYSLELIRNEVANKLIGLKIDSDSTKNRGQHLERMVLELLNYDINDGDMLYGAYPDIPNQLLEIKIQDTQTVDLGKFSPQFEEVINEDLNITTKDIRYLIALTNSHTERIEGIVLCPGEKLGETFTYVSDKSYKCQRSIPMSFFDKYHGSVVVNPD